MPIVVDENMINETRGEIEDGTYRGTESFNSRVNRIRSGKRGCSILDSGIERTVSNGSYDRLLVRQSESDTLRHLTEGSGTEKEQLKAVMGRAC